MAKTAIPKLNAEWHRQNRMPERATLDQRIEWHSRHVRHCACRPVPEKMLVEMKRRRLA